MLEFFVEHLYLDHDGWNPIFYTGKQPLNPSKSSRESHTWSTGFARHHTDVYGIESGSGLPETYIPSEVDKMEMLAEQIEELDMEEDMTELEKLRELTMDARNCGFLLTDLLNDPNSDGDGKNGDDDDDDDIEKGSPRAVDTTDWLDDSKIEDQPPKEDKRRSKSSER